MDGPPMPYHAPMREFLGFLLFLAIVFFVVGETVGWNVGVAGSTPIGVYKRSGVVNAEARTVRSDAMQIGIEGRVRAGEVEVLVSYQDDGSFQANRPPEPEETIFEETFRRGQRVAVDQLFDEGPGVYGVRLTFRDATGIFHVNFPPNVDR